MSKWISFSDRLPTKADADFEGNVMVLHPDNSWYIKKCYGTAGSSMSDLWVAECGDLCWLENGQSRPNPRTIEDVWWQYLQDTRGQSQLRQRSAWQDLWDEMKEPVKGQKNE